MRNHRKLGVALALIVALAAGALPFTAHAAATPLPADAVVLVQGHGWGHGRGMGQWGAKGMADSGKTWTQIVTHYYSSVTIGTRTSTESIRAHVDTSSSVVVTSDAAFTAWSGATKLATSDATYKFMRARHNGSAYVIERATASTGPWATIRTSSGQIVFRPSTALLQLVFGSGAVRYYRGNLEARRNSAGSLWAINELSMQAYLYGVVPRESPASWPAEQLKAQSVAARSYTAYKKDRARAAGSLYDICSTTACQVYGGYASKSSVSSTSINRLESSTSNAAVDATAGKVLLSGGKPILAEYSSSTGGYTAPGSVSYLSPVPDPADSASPLHVWNGKLTVTDIERKYPSIGRLVDVRVSKRNGYGDWGGRVLETQIVGTSATVTVSGGSFSSAFAWPTWVNGLRSSWFRVLIWKGDLDGTPVAPAVVAGQSAMMTVAMRNSGNVAWPVGGTVRIAVNRASLFHGDDWQSQYRPSSVVRNRSNPSASSVAPGQIAEFRVPLHAESLKPGYYSEQFRIVNDGVTGLASWFTVRVPVLPPWTSVAPNLLTNGSFELGLSRWSPSNLVRGDGASTSSHLDGTWSLALTNGTKRVTQAVSFAGSSGRRFVLSGWSRSVSTATNGGAIELSATIRYTDGTTSVTRIPFARGPHSWSYDEASLVASKPFSRIDLAASIASQPGTAFFDTVRLLESPAANPSFEDGMTSWTPTGLSAGDGSVLGGARDGIRWLKLTGGGDTRAAQYFPYSGARSETFVLSGWNTATGATLAGPAPALQLALRNTDGTYSTFSLDFPTSDHGWTRRELVVRAPKSFFGASIIARYDGQTGTAGFDDVRVTRSFVSNGSFENALGSWTKYGASFGTGDGIATGAPDALSALRLSGSGYQGVYQRIALSGNAGRRLVLSALTRNVGTRADAGPINVLLTFRNLDGTTSQVAMPLLRSPHDWLYAEKLLAAPKPFNGVDLYVYAYNQPGAAYFDAVKVTGF